MKKEKEKKNFYYWLYKWFAKAIRFFFRVHPHGTENVPLEGGFVVCANHLAIRDMFIIAASFPKRQIRYFAKAELFRIPIFKQIIVACGAVKLDRGGSDVGAMKKAIELASSGELVGLFPQGHRHPGENPADTEIKNGVGMISYHAKVPMIPVCIKVKGCRYGFFRRVDVYIGKPIPYEELGFVKGGSAEYRAAATRVFGEVCALGGYSASQVKDNDSKA